MDEFMALLKNPLWCAALVVGAVVVGVLLNGLAYCVWVCCFKPKRSTPQPPREISQPEIMMRNQPSVMVSGPQRQGGAHSHSRRQSRTPATRTHSTRSQEPHGQRKRRENTNPSNNNLLSPGCGYPLSQTDPSMAMALVPAHSRSDRRTRSTAGPSAAIPRSTGKRPRNRSPRQMSHEMYQNSSHSATFPKHMNFNPDTSLSSENKSSVSLHVPPISSGFALSGSQEFRSPGPHVCTRSQQFLSPSTIAPPLPSRSPPITGTSVAIYPLPQTPLPMIPHCLREESTPPPPLVSHGPLKELIPTPPDLYLSPDDTVPPPPVSHGRLEEISSVDEITPLLPPSHDPLEEKNSLEIQPPPPVSDDPLEEMSSPPLPPHEPQKASAVAVAMPNQNSVLRFVRDNPLERPVTMAFMDLDNKHRVKLKLVVEK